MRAPLRLVELLASISLATDLGTGQPLGHGLRTCAMATAIAEEMGCAPDQVRTVHQFALLRFVGCTADAAETAALNGGDDLALLRAMAPVVMGSTREATFRFVRNVGAGQPAVRRAGLVVRGLAAEMTGGDSLVTHCEVAAMLAAGAGLGRPVVEALAHAYERWDGKGAPDGLAGDDIPLAVRVAEVARDIDLAVLSGIDPAELMGERRGRAYDPTVVDVFAQTGPGLLAELDGGDEWERALAAEPHPVVTVGIDQLDAVLAAFSDFVDLKSPWIRGHSRTVAALAEGAGRLAGLGDAGGADLRGRGWSTTWVGSPSRTGYGTSRDGSPSPSGSGSASTPTTPSGSWRAVGRWRHSSGRRLPTTSASTAPATTAPSGRTTCRPVSGSWRRRTCSPLSPPIVRTGRRWRTTTRLGSWRARREPVVSTRSPSPPCSPPPGAVRPRRRSVPRRGSPSARWRCSG